MSTVAAECNVAVLTTTSNAIAYFVKLSFRYSDPLPH